MTQLMAREGFGTALRERAPAYSVLQACLRVQSTTRPPGWLARLFGRNPLSQDARSWYRGALAEMEIAEIVSELGPDWTVLHEVPIGHGDPDIDHLLIGPAGVFSIVEKNHSGFRVSVDGNRLSVNGRRTEHIREAEFQARQASKLLSTAAGCRVPVKPLIVVLNPEAIDHGKTESPVDVLASGALYRWLQARPRMHTNAELTYFSMIADEQSTWHSFGHATDDTTAHVQRFERLRHEVEAAHRRADAWRAALITIPASALLVAPLVLGAVAA